MATKPKINVSGNYTIDRGALARVKAALRERAKTLQAHDVKVGIHPAQGEQRIIQYTGEEGAQTVGYVALAHEFGAGVPARSWFRSWFDRNVERNRRQLRDAMREEAAGNTHAVELLAVRWAYELRGWIMTGAAKLAPLAPSTQRQRARMGLNPAKPLFAIGQIVDSIRASIDGIPVAM